MNQVVVKSRMKRARSCPDTKRIPAQCSLTEIRSVVMVLGALVGQHQHAVMPLAAQ